ncbi:MAG: hypothetical protein QF847_01075 [Candidatus Marinimicrobia bacterium]|nr:hypothetical protein [Candidatus Neomarinimicrobiota bacterium]MDP6500787.1 hypothetical protein [Candidatus Neomarinimicrobiota bacterium]MDP6725827.1 hypothetical protein [Candidatus Neomarinimicrobiota bacterium]
MKIFASKLSFKSDFMVTFLNGLIVIGGVFILNGFISRVYGMEVLGEFLLVKRTFSALVGILLLGMNVGLPNYLSRNFERTYGDNSFLLFLIFTIPATLSTIGIILLADINGFYFEYYWVYVVYSLGISAQIITYGLYRGYINMIGANIFQLLGTGAIPIIIFSLVSNLYRSLFWIGIVTAIIMIFVFIIRNKGIQINEIKINIIKQIAKYGFERLPSFIAQFILLAGIPIFLAQSVNFESVAYFNSSFSLVRLSLLIVNPISMILLPRVSNKIASGSKGDISNILDILFKAGLVFSIVGTIFCYVYAPIILNSWLGEVNELGIKILRLTIVSLPFYTLSGLARSPIDAASEKGYNSIIYGIAAFVMLIIIFIGEYLNYNLLFTALVSFLISNAITAIGSIFYIKKLFNYKLWNLELIRDLIISSILICTISWFSSLFPIPDLWKFLISGFLFLTISLIIFTYVKKGWLANLKSRIYG